MSNEYKDWERDKIIEEREIVNKYPFLHIRDIEGNKDTETKFPLMSLEIPSGWYKLFFQMCDDIKPLVGDDFYFLQVKEKYNTLRCYSNGFSSVNVERIIAKYEQMARYICTKCGRPATYETQVYIASYCDDCWKDFKQHEIIAEPIEFKPYFIIHSFNKDSYDNKKYISFEDEWNRYLKNNKFTDINYMIVERKACDE